EEPHRAATSLPIGRRLRRLPCSTLDCMLSGTDDVAPASEAARRAFRDCVGEFATGVTVVTAEAGGQPAGMTWQSFTSVSSEPLLVLVSLGLGSRTLQAVTRSGRFALSILGREQRDVALAFAERTTSFPTLHVERVEDALVVRDAVATLRCQVR